MWMGSLVGDMWLYVQLKFGGVELKGLGDCCCWVCMLCSWLKLGLGVGQGTSMGLG